MSELEILRLQMAKFLLDTYGISGMNRCEIDSLNFYTADKEEEFIAEALYEPSLCVVLQGAKIVGFGDEMYGYDDSRYLLASTTLPLNVRISSASKQKPYVSMALKFSTEDVVDVLKNIKFENINTQKSSKGVFFGDTKFEFLEPLSRLLWLLKKPNSNISYMADLIKKEILYTLITSDESGYFLAKFAMQGSVSNKISRIIAQIRDEFSQKLNIKELARSYNMSESSLYHNFKIVTSLSPLAFQKKIRLQEAKTMLSTTNSVVAQVAFDVGYESASQFSREYSRMFGIPPKEHSQILRAV